VYANVVISKNKIFNSRLLTQIKSLIPIVGHLEGGE